MAVNKAISFFFSKSWIPHSNVAQQHNMYWPAYVQVTSDWWDYLDGKGHLTKPPSDATRRQILKTVYIPWLSLRNPLSGNQNKLGAHLRAWVPEEGTAKELQQSSFSSDSSWINYLRRVSFHDTTNRVVDSKILRFTSGQNNELNTSFQLQCWDWHAANIHENHHMKGLFDVFHIKSLHHRL